MKGLLRLYRLKQHMVSIGIIQFLSNTDLYEHICLVNINIIYKSARKCDYQQHYKTIIEAAMVPTPEVFSENSPMSPGPLSTVKKPSARKSLRRFTELLYIKK